MIRPNIIKIICHDIGKHLGCYGVKTVSTRAIDSLAKNGILFNNAFANVNEIQSEGLISIYPNPSTGNISITSNDNINSVTITNTNGQVVKNKMMMSSMNNLDINNLDKGIYFVTCVLNNGRKLTERVIIQ